MRALKIRQAVALQAEEVYKEATQMAGEIRLGFQSLRGEGREGAGRGQLHQLEATVCSSDTVGAILDFVKRQTARLKPWRESRLGEKFLDWADKKLPTHMEQIGKRLKRQQADPLTAEEALDVRLMVIQEFVRALVSQVEYLKVLAVEAGGPV
jgi:hypothetical protein